MRGAELAWSHHNSNTWWDSWLLWEKGSQTGESRSLWVEQRFINIKRSLLPTYPCFWSNNLDWEPLTVGAGYDQKGLHLLLCEKGLRTREGTAGLSKEIWESFLSNTYTHTHLGFPGCLEHLLLQEMHDGAETFDINIVSSAQFVYRELKLHLKISLIQERTFLLLSWDTVAVESPLTKFIPTDVNSHTLKIKALWRHKCQSNPQARP